MVHVFISYKAEDRARVRPLVDALEADGVAVWWDAHLEGGALWRQSIDAQLQAAACVVVVWSRRSVGPEGDFVQDEASRAHKRGTYLPVSIDPVEPPLGFGQTQVLPLRGWKGDRTAANYLALLAAVRRMAGEPGRDRGAGSVPPGKPDRRALLAGGAAATLAVAAGAAGWALWRGSGGAASDSASIAVLPFENLSPDPDQAYFAQGLVEELRNALARVSKLKVIGRASSEAVRHDETKLAASKLGVANILTGSVRRSSDMIRVSAQLVDGRTGVERWSERYDRAPGDALALQSGIAESVARALSLQLAPAERSALSSIGTKNAAAHDLVLEARALAQKDSGEASLRRSLGLAEAAIALDPSYADAHAVRASRLIGLASGYTRSGETMRSGIAQGIAEARRAVELAPQLASAHAALAQALQFGLDLGGAGREYERAYQLAPGDAAAVQSYGGFLGLIGNSDAALKLIAKARALDPLEPRLENMEGRILFTMGRYADSAAAAQRSLARNPSLNAARSGLGRSMILLGRLAEAQAAFDAMPAGDPFRLADEALLMAKRRDRAATERALEVLRATAGDTASYQYAETYALLGDREAAFAALSIARRELDPGLMGLRIDPFLSSLRGDARFVALEKSLNFPSGDGERAGSPWRDADGTDRR